MLRTSLVALWLVVVTALSLTSSIDAQASDPWLGT